MVVQHVLDGNQIGLEPTMNLKGYVLGDPRTDPFINDNSLVPFAHRLTLISTELYNSLKEYCGGDYVNINASNTECVTAMNIYNEMVLQINVLNILEPNCKLAKPRKIEGRRSLADLDPIDIPLTELKNGSAYWCREYNHALSGIWANDRRVRDALQVRENTTGVWKRCNATLAYSKNVLSSVPFHQNLTKTSLWALIYSGDHDFSVPNIGTENWIHLLNLTTNEYWRPWFVYGQVSGYTEKFLSSSGDFTLIYATVKGAGHIAPEYKPKEVIR
ncbi:hypothetical protein LWI29_004027 [Acer saccharum]|uniref:Uncharacterized protein n=1 Tax=Acer saccharum TaxID=4024 RepID=A0AA39RBX5_ACESA|nr:hypothetical protein LWI29_004027 [Acer saccharum]